MRAKMDVVGEVSGDEYRIQTRLEGHRCVSGRVMEEATEAVRSPPRLDWR